MDTGRCFIHWSRGMAIHPWRRRWRWRMNPKKKSRAHLGQCDHDCKETDFRTRDAILLAWPDIVLATDLTEPNSSLKVCPDRRTPLCNCDLHCFCCALLPSIALSGKRTSARPTATNTTFTVIPIGLLSFFNPPFKRKCVPTDKTPRPIPNAKRLDDITNALIILHRTPQSIPSRKFHQRLFGSRTRHLHDTAIVMKLHRWISLNPIVL